MAIKVKDIREKEFTKQYRGYSADEVDEFLDQIADQMKLLIREAKQLSKQLADAQSENAKPAEPVAEQKVVETVPDDSSYFKNLREMLIGAQRLADDTVAEAKAKAEKILADAEAAAADKLVEAEGNLVGIKSEYESMVAKTNEYRESVRALIAKQLEVIEGK